MPEEWPPTHATAASSLRPYEFSEPAVLDEAAVKALRRGLREIHMRNSTEPVRYPTTNGAFPASLLATVPPVVADANVLRDDLLYACGHNQRTALANAANGGLLRLFCARHVVDEMVEHSAEWTDGKDVTQADFLTRWAAEYLPLIRVLDIDEDATAMLTPEEAARLDLLAIVDPDDLPSAVLALFLGAYYLTQDGPALRAVYGPDVDLDEYKRWREVLRAGGDAGQLGEMLQAATGTAMGLGSGVVNGIDWLVGKIGWIGTLAAGLGAGLLVSKTSQETRRSLHSTLSAAGRGFGQLLVEYHEASARLQGVSVRAPDWTELAEAVADPAEVLARACVYALARPGASDQSARSLRQNLPELPVPHGEAKVRAVLYERRDLFAQPWAGRFQVGHVSELVGRQLGTLGQERAALLSTAVLRSSPGESLID